MAQVCPACAEPASGGAWCEACGADLDGTADSALSTASSDPCVSCAAPSTDIAADGYCGNCGHKQPEARDHLEDDQGWTVVVTDRGKRHHRNEDHGAVAQVGTSSVLVVCDGVSSTDNPEQASFQATTAATGALVAALENGESDHVAAMQAAVAAGQAAALEVPVAKGASSKGSPSCTFVASITSATESGVEATIGWLGDSRAYWIDDQGEVTQLTTDHSWAHEQVADGLMTAEEANADRRAHTITRWLGDDAHDLEPGIVTHSGGAGFVLLCSDGLWNYADTDEAMTAQVAAHQGDTLLALAQNLVAFALESGGHDNTTVALADHSVDHSMNPVNQTETDPPETDQQEADPPESEEPQPDPEPDPEQAPEQEEDDARG